MAAGGHKHKPLCVRHSTTSLSPPIFLAHHSGLVPASTSTALHQTPLRPLSPDPVPNSAPPTPCSLSFNFLLPFSIPLPPHADHVFLLHPQYGHCVACPAAMTSSLRIPVYLQFGIS